MGNKISAFIIIAFCSIGCNASQVKKNVQKPVVHGNSVNDYNKMIVEYKSYVDTNLNTFKVVKKDIEGSSAEGGEAELYLNNNDTVKVSFTFFGETGKSEYEFYLKEAQLVFYQSQTIYYKNSISANSYPQIDSVITKSAILKNKEVLFLNRNDKEVNKNKWQAKSKEIIDLYYELTFDWRN